jgi:hypothetical protein
MNAHDSNGFAVLYQLQDCLGLEPLKTCNMHLLREIQHRPMQHMY